MLYRAQISPVQPILFGEGMQISLDNYYTLLKEQSGSLQAEEFMQLKLAADPIDISLPLTEQGQYEWYSYYNLLKRADLEIEPGPLSGTAQVGASRISDIYGKFLVQLSNLVVIKQLSADDLKRKGELQEELSALKTQLGGLSNADFAAWKDYADLRGYNYGDMAAYTSFSSAYGSADELERLMNVKNTKTFELIRIINKPFADADDQEIMTATVNYYSSSMRLPYPTFPDYTYLPNIINLNYLLGLPHVSTAVFDDRYVFTFDETLNFIKTTGAGALSGTFNRTTDDSSTINTDWGSSISVGYSFIHVNASVSEQQEISEDFKKGIEIGLSSKSSFRVGINYDPWFKPNLFKSKYIKDSPELFEEFFNENGSLLYYPTALIVIRGFSINFESSANWTYDYHKKFSASGGGGFNVFGINFGGSGNYSQDTKEHHVDQTGTKLTFGDDETTLRFIGYAVKKNTFWTEAAKDHTTAFRALHKMV